MQFNDENDTSYKQGKSENSMSKKLLKNVKMPIVNPKSLESDNYLDHDFQGDDDSVMHVDDENSYGNLDQHMLG